MRDFLLMPVAGTVSWGTAPDWVAAIATALTFAIALVIFSQAVTDRSRAHRRGQADLVAAWPIERFQTSSPAGMVDHVKIRLRNASNLPVYGVQVMMASPKPRPKKWPPDGEQMVGIGSNKILGPSETHTFEQQTMFPDGDASLTPPIQLTFTDAAGAHWRRNPTGELVELGVNMFDWDGLEFEPPDYGWWQWRKRRLPAI